MRRARSFTAADAAHLLRRAAFTPKPGEAEALAERGLEAAVEAVLGPERARLDAEIVGLEAGMAMTLDGDSSAGFWLMRMVWADEDPLRERLALMWHDHLVSALGKVKDPFLMRQQIALFRKKGESSFTELVQAVSRDPAMVRYLDSERSTKDAPNENFARELLELFTTGPGAYTEQDIKEAARAFTGYRIRARRFHFSPAGHDDGVKRFLGHEGPLDGDDVVALACAHERTPWKLAGLLARTFLSDAPDEDDLAELAASWKRHDGRIRLVLGDLFRSERFFARRHRLAVTRCPAVYATVLIRAFGARFSPLQVAARDLRRMGRVLLDPPSVEGYEGGPAWLDAGRLLARRDFALGRLKAIAESETLGELGIVNDDRDALARLQTFLFGEADGTADLARRAEVMARLPGSPVERVVLCCLLDPRLQRC